ncbi:holin-associated N-acetylmuramidase [Phaeobacter gallaeciensis]|uniref:Secretion activating protein n=1 Tax=Phaeobacter gallaeciensis TaxID=60890 RepID=A0AAC9Z8I6_9RHOB|nr:holin-associated N-acetylmuramidase [Phaeobacter gallaeciensis]AHD09399.1 Putative secretion activating protein [Phaeobacter gallaeciensis DSM 26640]ATE92662.1 Putative secretion activating protein [Phaeobacter gallaeciensis]ATE97516.1 Putative secretion activating protein [Phaeobacter gallaeciensis]ATF01327.1 Putative secretion activating protein [Phaeobacter gallaeciensis]ATF05707.1 Putative secretion activating protein [Phaeobacter gallaeciensis]
MQDIKAIAQEIVAREGGYVDDPDDPGGATKHGVTLGALQRLGMDLTRDGRIDKADVAAVSQAQAVDLYIRHYFNKPRIAALPEMLHPSVFDMYVNAGANAVRILQRLLVQMGYELAVDGRIGPKTAGAARAAAKVGRVALRDAYGVARRNYYFRIADRRPASRKYARTRKGGKGGWILRAESFISPRYHLSEAEFQARVSSWG